MMSWQQGRRGRRIGTATRAPARALRAALAGAALVALLAGPGGDFATAQDSGQESVRLDDFERTYPPNESYGKWGPKKIAPLFGGGDVYFFQFVHEGPDEHYIHLRSGRNNSFSLGVEDAFRVQDWPILEWEWKVAKLPEGGDVRVKARDDQAGSMCLIVDPGLIGFQSLCYIWENEGPKDTPITSTKRDDSRYLILRTGAEDGTGQWYAERRNMLEDYIRVFGGPPEEEAILGIQIDSDSVEDSAEAFYRNIYRKQG